MSGNSLHANFNIDTVTGTPNVTVRERSSDSDFNIVNPNTIPTSQSTRDFVKDLSTKSFWIRESRLIMCFIISAATILACIVLILRFNTCEVNTVSFSVISTILGAWLSLLKRPDK